MPTGYEVLKERLLDQAIRERVIQNINDVIEYATNIYSGNMEDDMDATGDWEKSMMIGQCYGEWGSALCEIEGGLPRPSPIMPGELEQQFECYYDNFPTGEIDDIYDHYVDHILNRLTSRKSSDEMTLYPIFFPYPEGPQCWTELLQIISLPDNAEEGADEAGRQAVIWRRGGMVLRCCNVATSSDAPVYGQLICVVEGNSSKQAIDALALELIGICRAVIRSIMHVDDHTKNVYDVHGINCRTLIDNWTTISELTDLAFEPSGKKNQVKRRMGTAIRLIEASDAQTDGSVSIALSLSAVEAILGENGPELSNRLAQRVATLLEPDPQHREEAIKLCKRLYDVRCDVVHGNQLDPRHNDTGKARSLAAAVVLAVWHRYGLLKRLGQDVEKVDELFGELQRRLTAGEITDGVPEMQRIQALWRGR